MSQGKSRQSWISGIDWSGDPGDPTKRGSSSLLVVAMASSRREHLPDLTERLLLARSSLQWSPATPFHFIDSDRRSRARFFEHLEGAELLVHVLVETKLDWFGSEVAGKRNRPSLMLDDAIARLVVESPELVVSGQTILIDRPRSETVAVRETAATIRRALRSRGVQPGPDVKPLPDHREDAQLIQVADMFAGAMAAWERDDPRLRRFGERLVIMESGQQKPRR